jgi:hypothetical protein
MSAPSLWPLVFGLLTTLVMLFLARVGGRWRRETIPATCKRCGYNVSHRPADENRCSECGAELDRPGAIVTVRTRRAWWLFWPALVAAGCVLLVFVGSVATYPWFTLYLQCAPLPWIKRAAIHSHGADGDVYRDAWYARCSVHPVPWIENLSAFFDHLLDLQTDDSASTHWQYWFNGMLMHGAPSDAQRERYVRQLFTAPPTFTVRTPVRLGDPLFVIAHWPLRGAPTQAKINVAVALDRPATIVDDRDWSVGTLSNVTDRTFAPNAWSDANTTPGRHALHLALARSRVGGDYPYKRIGERFDVMGTVELDVLPTDSPLGTPIVDPTKADAIAKAVDIHVFHWHDGRVFAYVRPIPADIDRAFTIYAVIDGVEKRIGGTAALAGRSALHDPVMYVPIDIAHAKAMDHFTLILVGAGDPLASTPDQQRYWAGRITYPDLPLETFADYQAIADRTSQATTRPYRTDPATTQPIK